MPRKSLLRGIAFAGLAALILPPAMAMWMMPSDAPVSRLVTNLTADTKEHPDDAEGFYLLGRVNSLAYTMKSRTVSVFERRWAQDGKPLPEVASDDFQSARWDDQ